MTGLYPPAWSRAIYQTWGSAVSVTCDGGRFHAGRDIGKFVKAVVVMHIHGKE
jgi:hypothetical protein